MTGSSLIAPLADIPSIGLDTDKVKRLRMERQLSQAQAAERAGLSGRQRWYEIESGRESNLTLETLDAIARALGVPAKELLK